MRIKNSLKNIVFGLSGQMISSVMGFIFRTVFIANLGVEYLGVSGLFSDVLTMLSLANLGFDTAIIYSMYKPLAENDRYKIQGLLNLYQKAYAWIGMVVLFTGLLLVPFLPYFMNGKTTISNIKFIYILFLINSVSSYFFVYKQSVIIADQRNHIISKINSIFTIISGILRIVILITTKNYIAILILQTLLRFVQNLYISHEADQLYPFIKKNNARLSKEDRRSIFKSLYALMLYKISGVVINGTDNVVISKFVGIIWVGMYSNYLLIIITLNTFLSYIFYSLTASIGNLNVNENAEKKYTIFKVINFTNFWIYGFCSVCLWSLVNPFITFWLGKQFIMNKFIVFTIILNFYTTGMQNASTAFRDSTGLFVKGKYRPVIAAVINLVTSIMLAQKIGIAGVFLGTVISRGCIYFWYDPYILYKLIFNKPVKTYYAKYVLFGFLVAILAFVCDTAGGVVININLLVNIIIRGAICIITPNLFFFILFRKSGEFKYLCNVLKPFISKPLFGTGGLFYKSQ